MNRKNIAVGRIVALFVVALLLSAARLLYTSHLLLPANQTSSNVVFDTTATVNHEEDGTVQSHNNNNHATSIRNSSSTHPPRIAYVTFSHVGPNHRWHDVILPASELFVPDSYYVVMTKESQTTYENWTRTDPAFGNARIQPIFVDCPEGKFGESPCCKQEQGLLYFYNHFYRDNKTGERLYEWILFMDDDMYIRSDELQVFVTELPIRDEPMVLTSDPPTGHALGQEGYLSTRGEYRCSRTNELFRYPWGQPVVYNQAAFDLVVEHGFRFGGLVKQCLEYNVTHDVGNALFHFMFSLPALWIRISSMSTNQAHFRGDFLGMHGVGRYGPKTDIGTIHDSYKKEPRLQYPYNTSNPQRMWSNTTGFRQTETYRKFGDPSNWTDAWHTMPRSDCSGV